MNNETRKRLEQQVVTAMERASRNIMQWGEDDCALWCANILRDVLGYDAAEAVRGRYRTRRGAARVMGSKGLLGQFHKAAKRHHWKRITPQLAQPGDVGLVWTAYEGKATLAGAICRRHGWFVSRNEGGFTAIRAEDIACAWTVLRDCAPGQRINLPRISSRPEMIHTSAAAHEPVSAVLGITALFEAVGFSAAAAGAIGGFLVTSALSLGFSIHPGVTNDGH